MSEIGFLSIMLGFMAGLLISKVVNRLRASNLIIKTMTVTQIQSLRMLAGTINHFYKIRNSEWNKDIANLDFQKYNLIVLDNFLFPIPGKDARSIRLKERRDSRKFFYFWGRSSFSGDPGKRP